MKSDRYIVVLSVLLAVIYFYAVEQIPSRDIGDPLGPKAIPRILGVLLLVAAGLLLLEMRLARKLQSPPGDERQLQDRGHVRLVAAIIALTLLYFAVFQWLGYALATAAYLLALMGYFNRGRWTSNVLTSGLFSFGSYLLFTKVFGAQLASGLLPF